MLVAVSCWASRASTCEVSEECVSYKDALKCMRVACACARNRQCRHQCGGMSICSSIAVVLSSSVGIRRRRSTKHALGHGLVDVCSELLSIAVRSLRLDPSSVW